MVDMKRIQNYTLTSSQIQLLSKIERFQGAFEATKFQRRVLVEGLKKSTIITSSGASTRIEGAILNDDQVKSLFEKGCKITKMSSRSEREVIGYIKALDYIYNHFEKIEISEKIIREIHQVLTSDLTNEQLSPKQKGAYKDITNDVVETDLVTGKIIKVWFKTTPPGPATAVAMMELIRSYHNLKNENSCHPLILIAGFIVHFLAIHPFRDGNGRTARLLTTLLLMKHGYHWAQYSSHEKIIEDNKEGYYISLREAQHTFMSIRPKYNSWIEFFLTTVSKQTEFLKSKIIKDSPLSVMNKNEKVIYLIIESNNKCNISFLLEQTSMTRSGLKSLLGRLLDKNIIFKNGIGKGTLYKIKKDQV